MYIYSSISLVQYKLETEVNILSLGKHGWTKLEILKLHSDYSQKFFNSTRECKLT